MDLSTKEEIFYNLAQKVAPTAINQMLTTTKYYSKAIVLAADLSLESHLKTSMTALILRGARQQPISTKKFKEDKFRPMWLIAPEKRKFNDFVTPNLSAIVSTVGPRFSVSKFSGKPRYSGIFLKTKTKTYFMK